MENKENEEKNKKMGNLKAIVIHGVLNVESNHFPSFDDSSGVFVYKISLFAGV